MMLADTGSPPLARSLRAGSGLPPADGGIIPARARFTTSSGTARWPATDHPRSRGVYVTVDVGSTAVGGSSPLARGLLLDVDAHLRSWRIIPARAGFTPPSSPTTRRGPDHPRSRGVYARRREG